MAGRQRDEPAPATTPGEPADPTAPPEHEPEVTPLDEDEHVEDGIEVNET